MFDMRDGHRYISLLPSLPREVVSEKRQECPRKDKKTPYFSEGPHTIDLAVNRKMCCRN